MKTNSAGWAKTYTRALRLGDGIAIAGALFLSLMLSGLEITSPLGGQAAIVDLQIPYSLVVGLMILGWVLTLEMSGSRQTEIFAQGLREYQRVFNGSLYFFVAIAALAFLFRIDPSRLFIGVGLALGVVFLLAIRSVGRNFIWKMRLRNRMLTTVAVVGSGHQVERVRASLEAGDMTGYRCVGEIRFEARDVKSSEDIQEVVRNIALAAADADLVLLADPDLMTPEIMDEFVARLDAVPLAFGVSATPSGVATARMKFEVEPGSALLKVKDVQLGSLARAAKRASDVVAAGFGVLLLSPIFIAVGIAVRLDTRGPAFFRQERVGQFERTFYILKFRTMFVDAEERLEKLTGQRDGVGNDVLFKLKEDPRITRVGKFLRKWSIDELPQLLNVLRGEMSLVGPRPPLSSEVDNYEGPVFRRLAAKPGLTGLWQISGRSDLDWEQSVRLDLQYVDNWSLLTDALIVAKTVPAVLRRKGAY